jgi:hypothetical protein
METGKDGAYSAARFPDVGFRAGSINVGFFKLAG